MVGPHLARGTEQNSLSRRPPRRGVGRGSAAGNTNQRSIKPRSPSQDRRRLASSSSSSSSTISFAYWKSFSPPPRLGSIYEASGLLLSLSLPAYLSICLSGILASGAGAGLFFLPSSSYYSVVASHKKMMRCMFAHPPLMLSVCFYHHRRLSSLRSDISVNHAVAIDSEPICDR